MTLIWSVVVLALAVALVGFTVVFQLTLSFANILSGSEINSLYTFLNRLICYKFPACCSFSGSGLEPAFASFVPGRLCS